MDAVLASKLEQAGSLVRAAGADVWLTFVRESSEGGDPVLQLIHEGGLTWQSALLVSASGRRAAVVGNYDADPLKASGLWHEVVPYVEGIRAPLLETLERLVDPGVAGPKIAVNYSEGDDKADGLTHGMYLLLLGYLKGTRFENGLVSSEAIIGPLRSRKSEAELSRMALAITETERLFRQVTAHARVGMTERELFELVQGWIDERGLGYAWDRAGNPIVNTGPDSMVGHGIASPEIRISPGHILHLDLGLRPEGYCSDIQRCWFVAEPGAPRDEVPEDVERALRAVSAAISAGAAALRPGVAGWEVDSAARRSIIASGYPEYLHAVGHAVGRKAHDGGGILGPRWDRYGRTPFMPVEEGQVYTLELGVMVDGRGYLGLEEMVRVRGDGLDWLTDRQLHLPVLS